MPIWSEVTVAKSLSALLLLCVVASTPVRADGCDAILNSKLMTQSEIVNETYATEAFKSSYCNKSFSEASSGSGTSAGVQYKLFSADVAQNESSFNKWKQDNCGDLSRDQLDKAFSFSAQKALPDGVVKAWEQCVSKSRTLACFVRPTDDPELVTMVVEWHPPGTQNTVVSRSFIENGANSQSQHGRNLYEVNEKIFPGQDVLYIKRNGKKNVSAMLSIVYNNDFRVTCDVFAPYVEKNKIEVATKPPDKSFNLVGDWCVSNAPNVRFAWRKYKDGYMEYPMPNGQIDHGVEQVVGVIRLRDISESTLEATYDLVRSYAIQPVGAPPPPLRKKPLHRVIQFKIIAKDAFKSVAAKEEMEDGRWVDISHLNKRTYERCE